jgi:hypothetical protein
MERDPRFKLPSVFSEIKLSITPDRAAVFVDGLFVGHVGEFGGVAKSLLVAPGHRKITISLPGYQTFNTEVDLAPNMASPRHLNVPTGEDENWIRSVVLPLVEHYLYRSESYNSERPNATRISYLLSIPSFRPDLLGQRALIHHCHTMLRAVAKACT